MADNEHPVRVPLPVFLTMTISFLALTVFSTILATTFRLRVSRIPTLPTILFLLSTTCILIAASLALSSTSSLYVALQIAMDMAWPSDDGQPIGARLLSLNQILHASSVLIQLGSYLAKASFVTSFRGTVLSSSKKLLRIEYWVILGAFTVAALVSAPLGFSVCSDFSDDFLQSCPVMDMAAAGRVYLFVTSTLAIITTLMTVAFAVAVLPSSPVSKGRKTGLAIAIVMSLLSIFGVVMRAGLSGLPSGMLDLPFIVTGFGFEVSHLSVLASLPAIKKLFGEQEDDTRGRQQLSSRDGWASKNGSRLGMYERSVSRDGVLKVDTEVRVESGVISPGRVVPPTPNVIKVGSGGSKRVSRVSDEQWAMMVRREEERERARDLRHIVHHDC